VPSLVRSQSTHSLPGAREYVVSRISSHYRLQRGKYVRDCNRLHVIGEEFFLSVCSTDSLLAELSRWFTERQLEELYRDSGKR